MLGQRLPDLPRDQIHDARPGDYWKVLDVGTGLPAHSDAPSNLTGTVWMFRSPDGNGFGTLMQHTVRENEDGTITVAPGDGSSNSVLHYGGATGQSWHGYIDHGDWREC